MRSQPWRPRVAACCALLGGLSPNTVAHAQSAEELSIRTLALTNAQRESAAGNHREALELGQRAGAILMAPSVRELIAREHRALGHRAAAMTAAQACLSDLDQQPRVPRRAYLQRACRGVIEAVRAQVGSLVLHVPADAPAELAVTVGGAAIERAALARPINVDVGDVRVEARATGRVTFERSVNVGPSEPVTLDVLLPPVPPPVSVLDEDLPAPTTAVAVLPATTSVEPPPARRESPAPSIAGPAVLWSVGGAAIVTGGVLFALRTIAVNGCPAIVMGGELVGQCPSEQALAAANGAGGLAVGSAIALGVGVAAIAAGVGWRVGQARATRERTLTVLPTWGGVAVGGSL